METSDPASVENACRVILRKAETRQFTGGVMFLTKEDGTMETILVGDLRKDLQRAKDVAEHGFACLFAHQVSSGCVDAILPRRLRKDPKSANDNICYAPACSMRR